MQALDGNNNFKRAYDKHVFVCINSRDALNSRVSCGEKGLDLRNAIVRVLAEKNIKNISVRINKSGCLDQCELGPVVVIYPQGFWYYNVNLSDVPEIIAKSIVGDIHIKRLSK